MHPGDFLPNSPLILTTKAERKADRTQSSVVAGASLMANDERQASSVAQANRPLLCNRIFTSLT
jgi:hypothetical protein